MSRQTEFQRICAPPPAPEPDDAWIDGLHKGTMRLNPQQRQAPTCLRELGALAALPVGWQDP